MHSGAKDGRTSTRREVYSSTNITAIGEEMVDRQPNVTIEWRGRWIRLFLDDRILARSHEIAAAIADAAARSETKEQLRRAVTQQVLGLDLEMPTYADDGGHYDPLEMLVTIGLRPAPEPTPPHVAGEQ